MNNDQAVDESQFQEKSGELEVEEKMPLLEWFANECERLGCILQSVGNKTEEGSQFCKGFDGIGGIL